MIWERSERPDNGGPDASRFWAMYHGLRLLASLSARPVADADALFDLTNEIEPVETSTEPRRPVLAGCAFALLVAHDVAG